MRLKTAVAALLVAFACTLARADQTISADSYLDKLHGMWLGELIGNTAGQGYMPGTTLWREGAVRRGGFDYDVGWGTVLGGASWNGDDDTMFEYMYADMLRTNASPTNQDVKNAWTSNIGLNGVYFANRQAYWLMGAGQTPPASGSQRLNTHWAAIDGQITTESIGAVAPGMRQRAADLVGQFAGVTNDGFAVHAAQFYGAMYAAAATTSDIPTLVQDGLAVVPHTSRSYQVVKDVVDFYTAAAAGNSLDWRAAQTMLYDNYGPGGQNMGRYRHAYESTVNLGMTTIALLYGGGDLRQTVNIGVLGGFDCDCNPATAGGLVGLVKGYAGVTGELGATPTDVYTTPYLAGLAGTTSLSALAGISQQAAEAQILAAGGQIQTIAGQRTYIIPGTDAVTPPPERPDPTTGPRGIVGAVLAAGGHVTVSAPDHHEQHNPANDRQNLDGIIDGITDVSYNGHQPYWTLNYNYVQPGRLDYYQLSFTWKVRFDSLVFYEGDIWDPYPNNNPATYTMSGGWFTDMWVEIGNDGVFTPATNVVLTDLDNPTAASALDPLAAYQRISITFDPAEGDCIRIVGHAGGTAAFTTCVELEAYGQAFIPEPATLALLSVGALALRKRRV